MDQKEDTKKYKGLTINMGVIATTFLVMSAVFTVWLVKPKHEPYISVYFKESILLKGDEAYIPELVQKSKVFLKENPNVCGVTGPNFGYFVQFICIKDVRDDIICAIDPVITDTLKPNGKVEVVEKNLLCDPVEIQRKERWNAIEVEFYDLALKKRVSITALGRQAHCLQFAQEIFTAGALGQHVCDSNQATKEIKTLIV